MERKQLVGELCDTLTQYPCLLYIGQRTGIVRGQANQVQVCNQDTQVAAYTTFQAGCFNEWAAEMRCLIARPQKCPCDGDDCFFKLPGGLPSPCPAESQALLDCMGRQPPSYAVVNGSVGPCEWYTKTNGACGVTCTRDPRHTFSANCDGVPDGAQACYCELNSVPLLDGPADLSSSGAAFYGDDCLGVAQEMADGECDRIAACCFTWTPAHDAGPPNQCSCISDPSLLGAPTCSGVATLGKGQVVDMCPQYIPGTAGFPSPDGP